MIVINQQVITVRADRLPQTVGFVAFGADAPMTREPFVIRPGRVIVVPAPIRSA